VQRQTETQQLMLLVLNTVMHLYIFTVWVAQVACDCICLHFYGVLPLVRQLSTPHHCTLQRLLASSLALGRTALKCHLVRCVDAVVVKHPG